MDMNNRIFTESEVAEIFKHLDYEPLKESFTDCFYRWREDEYRFDEDTAPEFLYDLVNWYYICLRNGKACENNISNEGFLADWVNSVYPSEMLKQYEELWG